jgi:hypothetical protein
MLDIEKRLKLEAHWLGLNRLILSGPEAVRTTEGSEDEEDSKGGESEKGKGRFGSGGTTVVSLWRMFANWITSHHVRMPGVLGVCQPSDGHPMQELVPDFGWFRPLAHNNQTWIMYWPDLTV